MCDCTFWHKLTHLFSSAQLARESICSHVTFLSYVFPLWRCRQHVGTTQANATTPLADHDETAIRLAPPLCLRGPDPAPCRGLCACVSNAHVLRRPEGRCRTSTTETPVQHHDEAADAEGDDAAILAQFKAHHRPHGPYMLIVNRHSDCQLRFQCVGHRVVCGGETWIVAVIQVEPCIVWARAMLLEDFEAVARCFAAHLVPVEDQVTKRLFHDEYDARLGKVRGTLLPDGGLFGIAAGLTTVLVVAAVCTPLCLFVRAKSATAMSAGAWFTVGMVERTSRWLHEMLLCCSDDDGTLPFQVFLEPGSASRVFGKKRCESALAAARLAFTHQGTCSPS